MRRLARRRASANTCKARQVMCAFEKVNRRRGRTRRCLQAHNASVAEPAPGFKRRDAWSPASRAALTPEALDRLLGSLFNGLLPYAALELLRAAWTDCVLKKTQQPTQQRIFRDRIGPASNPHSDAASRQHRPSRKAVNIFVTRQMSLYKLWRVSRLSSEVSPPCWPPRFGLRQQNGNNTAWPI